MTGSVSLHIYGSQWYLYLITESGFIEVGVNFPGEAKKSPQDIVDILVVMGLLNDSAAIVTAICHNRGDHLTYITDNAWHYK